MALSLFGKNTATTLAFGAAMTALVGKETVSAEEATAANTELAEAGITGAALINQASFDELTAKADRADTAEASVKATADALAAAGAKDVADLVAQRDKHKADAESFGSQPGELGTTATKEKADAAAEEGKGDNSWMAIHERMLQG